MEIIQLLGTAMGLGFVSGVNLYATVLAVGLGVNFGLIHLSPHLAGLEALGHPLVVVVAGVLYTVEFFADKVPWVDSVWDAVHTFIRIPAGAALAAAVMGDQGAALQVAAGLAGGTLAAGTHFAKAGARAAITRCSPAAFGCCSSTRWGS
jgi:hypothetical protein